MSTPPVVNTSPGTGRAPTWHLWAWGTLLMVFMCAFILWRMPDAEGLRQQVRATARVSMACFAVAYTASAMHRLWPGAFTHWVRRHRRPWGLLLASSHALHALGITVLGLVVAPPLFAELTPLSSRLLGGLGYACLVAMVLTSWDGAVRRLGLPRWRQLHTWCGHVLWLVFVLSCLKRIPLDLAYAVPAALLLAVQGVRMWAARQGSHERHERHERQTGRPARVRPSGDSRT